MFYPNNDNPVPQPRSKSYDLVQGAPGADSAKKMPPAAISTPLFRISCYQDKLPGLWLIHRGIFFVYILPYMPAFFYRMQVTT
ncbi:hypothetical protein [Chitinophaga defluvii]|uniref:Uncharacterized protein n=1 Tax=Chitinophaga defluvii TaxID=3163343 RepID=A0ABV2T8Z7_9BACT